MVSVPAVIRAACYARVSTEDQAERQTVQAQTDFERRYCDLHGIVIAGFYVDDGISGATPLEDRPEGRRLLEDAAAGAFDIVLVYRLDRLGRSLKSLLAAHEWLERAGVAIRSGTEPFDTASPIGKFLFSLLGSMAELERATIGERFVRGRDRLARDGKYTGGIVPTGYDLDDDGLLVPSARIVPNLGVTEAELVRDIFSRVAHGKTTLQAETARLTALGVPRTYRYGGPQRRTVELGVWHSGALASVIHNPTYRGDAVVRSRFGTVSRPAPALVDVGIWERAQLAVARNRKLAPKNAQRSYLLRGLLTCGLCGHSFTGGPGPRGQGQYRCRGQQGTRTNRHDGRCPAATIDARRLEETVWREVRAFIDNPGPYVEQAQQQLRERLATASQTEAQSKRLARELAGKEQERERVLGLFRRGRITADEAERELDAVAAEAAQIRDLIDSLKVRAEMAAAQEAYLSDVGAALARMRDRVDEIERTNDRAAKRELIELLAPSIVIQTEILGRAKVRQRKRLSVRLTLAFRSEVAVVPVTGRRPPARTG
jgi:site-specific DNA recombinase